ncbi:MAG: GNAT family N-acetyltransferase [Opitutaceae bacterium]|nr:GNAT family N-acetyltransferase [Opitutaceae bacterium]
MPAVSFNPFFAFPPAPPAQEDPSALEPRELLFGGRPHILRPLGPADEGRLISFFNSHTGETIRQRYGYHFAAMTPERARRLVDVDQSHDLALGVFERAADGEEVLHAVGRYLLDPTGRSAEMAFVVRESKRGLGICTALLRVLLRVARQRGMGHLYAQVQTDNAPMITIFRHHGGRLKPILGADAMEVFVPTAQP